MSVFGTFENVAAGPSPIEGIALAGTEIATDLVGNALTGALLNWTSGESCVAAQWHALNSRAPGGQLLSAAGSSLGGARPKVTVRDHDRHLAIAKSPNTGDETKTIAGKPWRSRFSGNRVFPIRRTHRCCHCRDAFQAALLPNGSALDNVNSSAAESIACSLLN
jgi:hypothetical protein